MYIYTCSFTGTDIHLHSITHKRTLKGAMSRAKVYFGNNRNGQGFRFPDIGDLCRVQISYSGRKHNHTKTRVILHTLHSYEVDLTIFHTIRKSVNQSNS